MFKQINKNRYLINNCNLIWNIKQSRTWSKERMTLDQRERRVPGLFFVLKTDTAAWEGVFIQCAVYHLA